MFTSDIPLGSFKMFNHDYKIYPTHYLGLSQLKLIAFKDTKGIGIGSGNFNIYAKIKMNEIEYHYNYKGAGRDSNYLTILAETGALGITAFLLFTIIFLVMVSRNLKVKFSSFNLAILGILVLTLIEGIFTYTMNFRLYWIFAAITTTLYQKYRLNET